MIIQSLTNPKIKHIVHLHTKSYRQQHQQFIAQGLKTVTTLLEGGLELHSIYLTEPTYHAHGDLFETVKITIVTDAIMKKMSTTITPSGIVAIFMMPQPISTPEHIASSIALLGVQDPGNLGTLIRTAAAMNIKNIFLIDGADAFSPKVIQATAGSIAFVNITSTSWADFKTMTADTATCALVVREGKSPEQLDLQNMILVIGSEGQGLPAEIVRDCDATLTIAMPGKTESLNAAVAGSIAMYLKSK